MLTCRKGRTPWTGPPRSSTGPWRPAPRPPSCVCPGRRRHRPASASAPGPLPLRPPPPKRHCRSLSVPEDLSRCRYTWRPSASRVWTPVSRQQCHGGAGGGVVSGAAGAAGVGLGAVGGGACPLRAPSSSLNSSLHSSSSPTFFSLALSPDSPLPWTCCCFFPSPSSCSSSPSPLHPLPPQLPRCHSQPCDLLLLKPGLKRRRDPDRPCARPVLDFTKMTQVSQPSYVSSELKCWLFLTCVYCRPYRRAEEVEEREAAQQAVFERDCTELDLNLIEEN
uniref:Uncharacterized protein n=1 Tax=Salarias fasciatus TaxID=181472 RepID=A0A672F504_SALFA